MLLAIDIGNTTISLGVLKKNKMIDVYNIKTASPRQELARDLNGFLFKIKKNYPDLRSIIICSVVPKVTKIVQPYLKKCLDINPVVVGQDIIVPIKNNYHDPRQVGQDRLVCAFAVKCFYGVPAIVIDFGTATTLDVVSGKGEYEGGMIVPGIQLSVESLFQKTALLPRIDMIKPPRGLIGKNTQESILSGIFYGYGMMCSGLIDLLRKQTYGNPRDKSLSEAKVFVTGGYASLMKRFIFHKVDKVDPHLVFKGLYLLHKEIGDTAFPQF
ncbi:MAG TPA: hypothetical protein DD723_04075 [Candidatus Omnitrophica bacterium]|nr:MAG: hypothetical protein A2Z81_00225 [Omnitrophica WOR_2 bacterium GWA2_45_18]HBR14708.1 hypothetical protein [Candidatus Omnitrophota bacterium]